MAKAKGVQVIHLSLNRGVMNTATTHVVGRRPSARTGPGHMHYFEHVKAVELVADLPRAAAGLIVFTIISVAG